MDKPLNSDPSDTTKPAAVNPSPAPAKDAAPPPPPDADLEGPPLTPVAWLKQNGFYLVALVVIVFLLVFRIPVGSKNIGLGLGWSGLWQSFLVVIGLGFVIFIHELGHFLTAKWCDVHVQTFSLGFGPPLPGCSFRYGETLYKIALFPLGGYVGMVGEGTELEGNDDYPRSFKNKSVGQRMLIISAGVIMNVIFGCIAFVLVYRFHGIERPTMVLASTEPGGPTWQAGVRSGSRVTKIGKSVRMPFASSTIENPYFEELRLHVTLSAKGDELAFATEKVSLEGGNFDGLVTPRSDKNDSNPVIGVMPAPQLVLVDQRMKTFRAQPVLYHSPAAAARVIPVAPGATVVAATDPGDPDKVTPVTEGWAEVTRRLRKLEDKPIVLQVRSKTAPADAKPEEMQIGTTGFEWEDVIVGMTDPDQRADDYDPFVTTKLRVDETNKQKKTRDYFEYHRRLIMLAGKPIVIQVLRKGSPDTETSTPVNLLVPSAYHRTLGVHMAMGEVAAVRDKSPALAAGLQVGDVITHASLMALTFPYWPAGGDLDLKNGDFDPCKLPFQLRRLAASRPGLKVVTLTVDRPNPPGSPESGEGKGEDKHKASKEVTIGPMVWDDSWDYNAEYPTGSMSALSIAQLGIAYRVDSTIKKKIDDSPADKAGLKRDDEVIAIAMRKMTLDRNAPVEWNNWVKLESTRGDQKRFDRWASADFTLQALDFPDVQLRIKRGDKEETVPADLKSGWLTMEEDPTWPEADRGLFLSTDTRLQKADSMWDALQFGVSRTGEFILVIYQGLRSLLTGRVSAMDNLQGPINIAQTAFFAAEDPFGFLLFLGLISVNLAVVNFLPIPVLDGGHMVFLIYEKLRGKPASESVQKWAMIGGLLLIGSMMVFVLYKEAVMPFLRWMWRF